MPDVPTLKEQGFPIEFTSWLGVVAPAKTPHEILTRLNEDVRRAAEGKDARKKLEALGFTVAAGTSEEFAHLIRKDTALWGKVVSATGFQAD